MICSCQLPYQWALPGVCQIEMGSTVCLYDEEVPTKALVLVGAFPFPPLSLPELLLCRPKGAFPLSLLPGGTCFTFEHTLHLRSLVATRQQEAALISRCAGSVSPDVARSVGFGGISLAES